MVSVDMMQMHPFTWHKFMLTVATLMVLPVHGFRGSRAVELTFAVAPVSHVAVIGRFTSFDTGQSGFWRGEPLETPDSAAIG